MNMKIFIISSALILLLVSVILYVNQALASVTKVKVSKTVTPGYYWCQYTNGTWSTYSVVTHVFAGSPLAIINLNFPIISFL